MRARFRNYSIEQHLDDWISPLVENRTLGFTSKSQVMHYALRKLLDDYLALGIHPWSKQKQKDPSAPAHIAAAVLVVAAASVAAFLMPGVSGAIALDVPHIYNEYAPFIDFFLYLAFFVGVVQVGLGRTLPNRAITISLATILALGAASMEPVFGYTLRSLGPVAVGLFLLISSLMVYRTLRAFEIHKIGAGVIVIVLLYIGLAAFLPSVNAALMHTTPVLPFLTVLILAILVVKFSDSRFVAKSQLLPREILPDAPGLAEEERLVRRFLAKNKEGKKDEQALLAGLAELLELLDKVGTVPEARNLLAQRFKQILPKVHPIEEHMENVESLAEQVERVDLKLFADLKNVFPKLSEQDRKAVRNEIKQAMNKLGIEKQLKELAKRVRQHTANLREHLEKAEQFLNDADLSQARERIHLALARERGAAALLEDISSLESALLELTTRELKSLPE